MKDLVVRHIVVRVMVDGTGPVLVLVPYRGLCPFPYRGSLVLSYAPCGPFVLSLPSFPTLLPEDDTVGMIKLLAEERTCHGRGRGPANLAGPWGSLVDPVRSALGRPFL